MPKVQWKVDLSDETIRELEKLREERPTKTRVIRDAISEALFFEEAKKVGRSFFLGSDDGAQFKVIGLRGPGALLDASRNLCLSAARKMIDHAPGSRLQCLKVTEAHDELT